jgi:hypothetical protein
MQPVPVREEMNHSGLYNGSDLRIYDGQEAIRFPARYFASHVRSGAHVWRVRVSWGV